MRHGSHIASDQARSLGMELADDDFRAIALAITDSVAGDGLRTSNATAGYVGPTRGSERWTIALGTGEAFDVIYVPARAQIVGVTDTRRAAA